MQPVAFQAAPRSLNLLAWMNMKNDKSLRQTHLPHWQLGLRPVTSQCNFHTHLTSNPLQQTFNQTRKLFVCRKTVRFKMLRLCYDVICIQELESHILTEYKENMAYQSSNRRGQPIDPLDNTGLDLVDQTVSRRDRTSGNRTRRRVSESTLTSKEETKSVAKFLLAVFMTCFNGGHLVSV